MGAKRPHVVGTPPPGLRPPACRGRPSAPGGRPVAGGPCRARLLVGAVRTAASARCRPTAIGFAAGRGRRALDRPARAPTRGEARREEHAGPAPLEDAVRGEGAARRGVGRQRPGSRGGVREQGLAEVVPRDHRCQRVHPRVVAREQQGERPAVRPARDAHPGIARAVLHHLGTGGQPVHERAGVRDLVVRRVERDLPPAGAEPARRPGEHDEPPVDERAGVGVDRGLRAAEPVGDQHGRRRRGGGEVQGGVEGDRALLPRARRNLDPLLDRARRRRGGRRRRRRRGGEVRSAAASRATGSRRQRRGRAGRSGVSWSRR